MQTEIRALTYNICWGCMLANKRSQFNKTSKALADKCIQTKKAGGRKTCLQNIADHIDLASPDAQLDFVGTQESAKWQQLQRSSRVLRKMTAIHHLTANGVVHLATFYNHRRWRLDAVKVGDLLYTDSDKPGSDKPKPETGRPYHILYLTELSDPQTKYIVINMHNGHFCGAKRIIENLSSSPARAIPMSNLGLLGGKELETKKESAIYESVIKGNTFQVIMMGDFNDGGKDNYYKGIRPFAESGISELKDIRLSSQGHIPPETCCTPSRGTAHIRRGLGKQAKREFIGDYILISKGLKYTEPSFVPTSSGKIDYDARRSPASDHLPVMAVIRK